MPPGIARMRSIMQAGWYRHGRATVRTGSGEDFVAVRGLGIDTASLPP
jgi:hypothetical protein